MIEVARSAKHAFMRVWESAYYCQKVLAKEGRLPDDKRMRVCIPRQPDDDDELVANALDLAERASVLKKENELLKAALRRHAPLTDIEGIEKAAKGITDFEVRATHG